MNNPPILVTGARGFLGSHLLKYYQQREIPVIGATRFSSHGSTYLQLNTNDFGDCIAKLMQIQPQAIIHCAGQSDIAQTWVQPIESWESNTSMALFLLEAIRKLEHKVPLLLIGSLYETSSPIGEAALYTMSKLAQTGIAIAYANKFQLPVFVARPTTLIGPGYSRSICAKWISKVVAIEKGDAAPYLTGYALNECKEYLDVRDACSAIDTILQNGAPGAIYDLTSGVSMSFRELLQQMTTHSLSKIEIRETQPIHANHSAQITHPFYIHAISIPAQRLGWTPRIPIEQSLKDQLNFARRISS